MTHEAKSGLGRGATQRGAPSRGLQRNRLRGVSGPCADHPPAPESHQCERSIPQAGAPVSHDTEWLRLRRLDAARCAAFSCDPRPEDQATAEHGRELCERDGERNLARVLVGHQPAEAVGSCLHDSGLGHAPAVGSSAAGGPLRRIHRRQNELHGREIHIAGGAGGLWPQRGANPGARSATSAPACTRRMRGAGPAQPQPREPPESA